MANYGFNFRATSGYVTDGAGEIYVLDSDTYPTTRGGKTFGWETAPDGALDQDSGVDVRLAGVHYQLNDATQAVFRVDLDGTGDVTVRLALGMSGGGSAQAYQYLQITDTSTPVLTLDKSAGTGVEEFYDATGVLRTSAADWVSNNASDVLTFSSTILRVRIGATSSQSNASTLAHLYIEEGAAGDTTAPTLSSATASATGATTASGSVTTDEGNGTLYWYISTSATPPSVTDLQAGTGAADSGSQAVSTTGAQSITGGFSGLSPNTTYYAHYQQRDAATNDSAVATSAAFATLPSAGQAVITIPVTSDGA